MEKYIEPILTGYNGYIGSILKLYLSVCEAKRYGNYYDIPKDRDILHFGWKMHGNQSPNIINLKTILKNIGTNYLLFASTTSIVHDTPYGRTKRKAEDMIMKYDNSLIVRIPPVRQGEKKGIEPTDLCKTIVNMYNARIKGIKYI